jgi:steroid delta-isomerase-like uncharacterized protein
VTPPSERGQLEPLAPDSLADRWLRAWTSGEFVAVCTADIHYEDPATREPLSGLSALETHSRAVHDAFPDLQVERTGPRIGDDRYACVPWRAAGTHRGALPALPGSNRFVTLHGVHFVELVDGRIRRARGFFDLYEAAVQLGLLPGRGSIGETAMLLLRGFGLRR